MYMNKKYNPIEYSNDEIKNKCGIYQIRNIVNNKIYIGSTKDLYTRKRSHFYDLDKNKHRNSHLQKSYRKYGKENFVFEIIEFCTIENQINNEQYWLDELKQKFECYNIQPKAGRIEITEEIREKMKGKVVWNKGKTGIYSQEALLKMKNSHQYKGMKNPFYGKRHSQETKDKIAKANGVGVLCIDTNIVYSSIMEAERQTGANHSVIIRCCKGIAKTAGGYRWKYL